MLISCTPTSLLDAPRWCPHSRLFLPTSLLYFPTLQKALPRDLFPHEEEVLHEAGVLSKQWGQKQIELTSGGKMAS